MKCFFFSNFSCDDLINSNNHRYKIMALKSQLTDLSNWQTMIRCSICVFLILLPLYIKLWSKICILLWYKSEVTLKIPYKITRKRHKKCFTITSINDKIASNKTKRNYMTASLSQPKMTTKVCLAKMTIVSFHRRKKLNFRPNVNKYLTFLRFFCS